MTDTEKQLVKIIKAYGYKMTSDNMGIYFTGHNNKFSFIKTGNIYNCYHNKSVNDNYELQDKLLSQILFEVCLRWVLSKVSKKENKK